MRIALMEEDPRQMESVSTWLEGAGYTCHVYAFGQNLIRALSRESFDLFLVSWTPSDVTGEDLLQAIRRVHRIRPPIIVMSPRVEVTELAAMIRAGASDYLIRPISREAMLTRIEGVFRDSMLTQPMSSIVSVREFEINLKEQRILRNGTPIVLTQKEFGLGAYLLTNVGRQLSRGQLLHSAWGSDWPTGTRTLDTHISRLRTKLSLIRENGWDLHAIYRQGYRLENVPVAGKATAGEHAESLAVA